jgi:ABC-type antimicrobial peptide transport system permease subunit
MKTTAKSVALVLLVATAIFAVSCGGNANKKQGEEIAADIVSEVEQQIKDAAEVKNVSDGWERNEYTEQLPKPDIAVTLAGESGMGYGVNFNNATLDQIKAYAVKVKEAGFDEDVWETDGDTYMYSAGNAAGWSVMLSWTDGQSGILISKP